jgi:hypothetical protein
MSDTNMAKSRSRTQPPLYGSFIVRAHRTLEATYGGRGKVSLAPSRGGPVPCGIPKRAGGLLVSSDHTGFRPRIRRTPKYDPHPISSPDGKRAVATSHINGCYSQQ